jgi:hypothetical protein
MLQSKGRGVVSALIWCTPKQCKKKSGRESFFGRRAAGGRTGDPRSDLGFTTLIFTSCRLQAPEEYKNDLWISGYGRNPTTKTHIHMAQAHGHGT